MILKPFSRRLRPFSQARKPSKEETKMHRLGLRASLLALGAAAAIAAATLAATANARSQVTTITFWQTMNEQETVTLKTLVSQFEASHPDIKIDMVTVPFSGHDQKFTTAAQAGQAPDVMRADTAPDVQGWAAQGLLTDLTSMISAKDKADFVAAAFKGAQYNGKAYAVPQTVDALALFYNKSLFKAKGLKAPPKTLAQLVTYCQKLGNQKGIALRADSYWLQPWIWGYGGGLVNMSKKQILIASQKSIAGWSAYNSLFQNKCAFPDKDYANDYGNVLTAFKNGQVAMIVNGPWSTADVLSGPAFKSSTNFQVATLPPGPGGQGSPIGGASFVISRNSQHAAEAYTFISWLTAPAQQAVFATKNNLLPSHVSAYALPAVRKNRLIVAFGKQMQVATDRTAGTQGAQLYTDFTPAFQEMLSGKKTPAAAAATVANAWKQKLFPDFTIVK
jgi:arabinogalactan oligomer/maltooligosaccharide transport system substrate-binding protein